MRAINHALSGAVIGLAISEPLIAAPLAFLSHFAMDAIPHHVPRDERFTSKEFSFLLIADMVLCVLLVLVLALWRPQHWLITCVCAFLATSPDLFWIPRYIRERRAEKQPTFTGFIRFHIWIQWSESPAGGIVEVAWFVLMAWLLYGLGIVS